MVQLRFTVTPPIRLPRWSVIQTVGSIRNCRSAEIRRNYALQDSSRHCEPSKRRLKIKENRQKFIGSRPTNADCHDRNERRVGLESIPERLNAKRRDGGRSGVKS